MLQHVSNADALVGVAKDLAEQRTTIGVDHVVELPLFEQPLQFAVVHVLKALVARVGRGKRWEARQQNEDEHAQAEHVRLLAVEPLIRVDLWRDVALLARPNIGRREQLRPLVLREATTQSKIAQLDHVVLLVPQHILERNVEMTVAAAVHEINGLRQLQRVLLAELVGQTAALVLEVRTQVAARHVFETQTVEFLVLDRIDESAQTWMSDTANLAHKRNLVVRVLRHSVHKLLLHVFRAKLNHFFSAFRASQCAQQHLAQNRGG
mmetsp:Transcript_33488/g.54520  ORF Transcript_33488/g.54520 Transcript_33488/m.54520 type:complete len:265 (+) Transcript_33488:399-1193(+)